MVIFEPAPDRVLKITILCRRQSLDDLIWARSKIVRGAPEFFGLEINELSNLELVLG